jgi:hypothetical protein
MPQCKAVLHPSYIPSPSHHHPNITGHRSITIVLLAITAMDDGITLCFPMFPSDDTEEPSITTRI